MKHLGDITKINGAEIEIVDVITGGSPCQDLSIAGKRAGLAGARSGLFMEQVRIVKEMREHDRANGRTGDMVRPRFMIWENVPGAFSSNKGRDFAAVLEEIIRIAEPEAPDIEVPEKGWPTWVGYHDEVGGRWSVAWRVHDAQYWGVPQRRRRISVVADFGGDTAGEILFERKSVSGHPAESGAARERLAGNAESGASYAVRIRGGCDGGGKGALVQEDKSGTLGTGNDQTIFCLQGNGIDRADTAGCNGKRWREDTSYTLNTIDRPAVCAGVNNPAIFCTETQRDCVMPSQALTEVASTLRAGAGAPKHDADIRGRLAISYKRATHTGFEATPINLMVATRYKALGRGTGFGVGEPGDPANTISSAHSHGVFVSEEQAPICMATQQGGAEVRSDDRAPTLTASAGMSGNNQPVICIQGNAIDRADTAGCNGKGWKEDVCYTLNTIDRPAVCAGPDCLTPWDCQSKRVYSEAGVMPTLQAGENSGQNQEAVLCAGFKLGNSEHARSIGYAEEQAPTLNAECGGNKPAVLCLNDQGGNVMGVSHDVSGTLRAQEHGHQPSILDMSHACDVIRDCGEVAPSLQARMGTGGNQIPLTYQMQGFGDYREGEVASSCKQRDFKDSTDLVCAVDCRDFREGGETNGTLQAKSNGGISYNLQNTVRTGIVRRLTPMECERLQGYPDGWTDIGEWMDSKGKRHKDADRPRYKALGNSIALPFWDFLAKRISAQYLRPVTMGSLFDGIGGFPLVFERHNGKGTARWASEIEEFPIAVTKLRFGED
jgi:DNA (cytosine-5)-methyltransferase 1|nr:MAG TPA: Cytosine specific methyltransferase [Bacteriophage sp.]